MQPVTELVRQLGALGVFLLMVPESACIPVPSELTLLFAGFAVGQGWLSFPAAVLAGTAGNLVGSMIAYGVGASGVVARVPGASGVVSRWDGLLARHGNRAVFIARLLPLARSFVSLPAGVRRVPIGEFVALTVAGCAIWAAGFILIGMVAGNAWTAVGSVLGKVLLGVGITVLVLTFGHRQKG
ncbi:MAG TPA: DedA family protein [Solirubrobacteraceae bacterium]|nr:DedA family protein [Solirubrobacteraceae bacterium]